MWKTGMIVALVCSSVWAQSDPDARSIGNSEYIPLWQELDLMSMADKENALIQLEPLHDPSPDFLMEIEELWNSGDHDLAIQQLRRLEEAGGVHLAAGIHWIVPKPASLPEGNPDTQVEIRGKAFGVHLDFHGGTKNLFAVIRRYQGGNPRWTVNISKDDGLSWNETYAWDAPAADVVATSAAVVDQYLYIAYVADDGTATYSAARMRRCSVSDGSIDGDYSYKIVFDKGMDIEDIALATNADSIDSRLYFFTILTNGTLTYHWATQTGATWNEIATGVNDALSGLDACFNEGYADNFVMASFRSTTDRVKVALRSNGWDIHDLDDTSGDTAIAAYSDYIITVFPQTSGSGQAIKYQIAYTGGSTWLSGTIASALAGELFGAPDVTARKGGGIAVIYTEQVGEPDPLWYTHRPYATPNWTAAEQINEVDVTWGWDNNIEWIPPLYGANMAYGILWTKSFPTYEYNTYFKRTDEGLGFLTADWYTLDAGAGGTVNFSLDAGVGNAFRNYLMLGGVTGIEPGFNLPGGFVTLPLNWDAFTDLVLNYLNTALFQNFLGTLNGSGISSAALNSPPLSPTFVGLNMYFAYCLNAPFDFASNPVSIKIVP